MGHCCNGKLARSRDSIWATHRAHPALGRAGFQPAPDGEPDGRNAGRLSDALAGTGRMPALPSGSWTGRMSIQAESASGLRATAAEKRCSQPAVFSVLAPSTPPIRPFLDLSGRWFYYFPIQRGADRSRGRGAKAESPARERRRPVEPAPGNAGEGNFHQPSPVAERIRRKYYDCN